MSNRFIEGLIYRCNSDFPNESDQEWMRGFNSCIEKLGYLEQALAYIVFDILAVREFCMNSNSLEYTGKNETGDVAARFQKDIPVAFARMAFNTAILAATKLYEITKDPKHSKHLRPLMETLSQDALNALDKRISSLDSEKLKYLRDKIVAHIDPVSYQSIDLAVAAVCPNNDLLAFLDILEPRTTEAIMSTHEAIEKITNSLKVVPGYNTPLN